MIIEKVKYILRKCNNKSYGDRITYSLKLKNSEEFFKYLQLYNTEKGKYNIYSKVRKT